MATAETGGAGYLSRVWRLLEHSERRTALVLTGVLLMGTLLDVLSLSLFLPLISALSGDGRLKGIDALVIDLQDIGTRSYTFISAMKQAMIACFENNKEIIVLDRPNPLGGLKVTTENGWFAARPSGTEDVYKIYAESFKGPEHLAQVQEAAREVVNTVIA